MNIAFISYELPPDTGGGGIGSYIKQISSLLTSAGKQVTIFTSTPKDDYSYIQDGVNVYRIKSESTLDFRMKVVETFVKVHSRNPFDIIEAPDYGADGIFIKLNFPKLPYVVKLHSPSYLVANVNNYYAQYILPKKYLVRLKNILFRTTDTYVKEKDIEYLNVLVADQIVSPSKSLAKKISSDWGYSEKKISIIENPYIPDSLSLSIPLTYTSNRITFIGKLSILKGALDFIEIIPMVLATNPELQFRFIGKDSFSPVSHMTMSEYITHKLQKYQKSIEFIGEQPHSDMHKYLADTDILICNSLWENYPTVILEAMGAARVVIATVSGGIPEIISNNFNGILVPVKSGKKLANRILDCYRNKELMAKIGANGRDFIMRFNSGELSKKIISSYESIISS